ncbi:MAG: glycosyltransferase [Planctomycetota bacterium]
MECAHARRLPHVRATEPERFLEGVRVVLFGRNRADRLRRALDALAGASRRGAEIVYVDGGSRDRSADVARRHPAGARAAADLASAAFGGSEPRFVACASLRCDVDWRCLDAMARNAARSSGGALHAARLVGPDGATIEDGPVALAGEAAQDRALPAVWLARAGDARAALEGRFEGPIRRRVDATALLVEPAAAERR